MAGRNALGKSGFRPYQKGMNDHPQPPKYPKQRQVTYRMQPDGNTYREVIEDEQMDRKYEQVDYSQSRIPVDQSKTQDRDLRTTGAVHVKYPEPIKMQSQRPVTYRVTHDGKTYRDQPDEEQKSRKYDQPETSEIIPQNAVIYRVLPDGKTYREQPDDEQNSRKHKDSNLAPQKPAERNIRETRVTQNPEPRKFNSEEEPVADSVKAIMQNEGKGKGKLHRWTMFRLWVNREITQEVRKERDANKELNNRLDLPMDSMVTSVLVDPESDKNGKRLQKVYGAKTPEGQRFNILPENLYFVFGIPRAKSSTDASVSEFLETMSNAVSKSEQDILSTKDDLSTKDYPQFRKTRGLAPEVGQRKPPDQYNKDQKGETNDDKTYQRWHASDLKTSRYKHADDVKDNGKDWEDERVKKPGPWESDNFGKSRKWQSEDDRDRPYGVSKQSPKPSNTDNDWNLHHDGDLRKSRNTGEDEFRKSRTEEFTDFGKYHFDSYEMPKTKRKEILSDTRAPGENIYATHVHK